MSNRERFNGTESTARTFSEEMRQLVDDERAKGGLLLPFYPYAETTNEVDKTEDRFPLIAQLGLGATAVSRFEKRRLQ